jgi:nucleoside 2-deoxyribosyltransferase
MAVIAEQFEANGHEITWKWWDTPDIPENANRNEELTKQAFNDKRGVEECQVLVLINSDRSEGKAFEQGLAVARRKPIIAVGKLGELSMNVFHYLDCYIWVETIQEAIEKCSMLQFVYDLYEKVYAS